MYRRRNKAFASGTPHPFRSRVMGTSRFVFATDLHASTTVFEKLLQVGINERVGSIVIGGDLSGKSLVILRQQPDGRFISFEDGPSQEVEAGEPLEDFEALTFASGRYPIRMSEDEFSELQQEPSLKNSIAEVSSARLLAHWIWLAEKRLAPNGIRLLMICGNDDPYALDDVIERSRFVENPERKVCKLEGGHEVIGESAAVTTSLFDCPRDLSEPEIKARIMARLARVQAMTTAICVFHAPPMGTGLDIAAARDGASRVKRTGGEAVTVSAGSEAVREIIQQYQPLLTLHGHIHESPQHAYIGRTLCLNPGTQYLDGTLCAFVITVDAERVLEYRPVIV